MGNAIPGRRRAPAASLFALAALSCGTLDIVKAYNTGPHGTIGDPGVTPADASVRLLRRMIVNELSGAYFEGAQLRPWFEEAKVLFPEIVQSVPAQTSDAGPYDAAIAEHRKKGKEPRPTSHGRFRAFQTHIKYMADTRRADWRAALKPPKGYCDGGKPSADAKRFADALRFQVSLTRAAVTASGWLREGLIDPQTLSDGARQGFDESATYMEHRRYHREIGRPNIGIVISGGASNGMFSAGAVWTILHIIDGCLSEPAQCPVDPRFRIISGTSAGAMVAVVVDKFNSAWEDCSGQRITAQGAGQPTLDKLTRWFTCLPAQQLYCAENDSIDRILNNVSGIVDFDGARWLLGKNVTDDMLHNASELLIDTVDFQSGALLAQSDQNPADTRTRCDVVTHALSSVPEPFIAKPIRFDAGAGAPPTGFYLDGGVRSVVPLLPLVRHGAEKVVIVSSSPSVVEGAAPPQNAIDVLNRYSDIATNSNGEDGIALAEAFANLQAAREEQLCQDELHCDGREGDEGAACDAFCAGHLAEACRGAERTARIEEYPVEAVYRNEERVPPAAGYSFDPRQSLPLFLAGMSAVRERCAEFAEFLGIPKTTPASSVARWCNHPMPTPAICESPDVEWPLKDRKYSTKHPDVNPPTTIRACDPAVWKDNPPECP
jgi:predicted acylesterase/phospholipase RssA